VARRFKSDLTLNTPQEQAGIDPQKLAQFQELNHVDPTLSVLDFRYEGLRTPQQNSEIRMRKSTFSPL